MHNQRMTMSIVAKCNQTGELGCASTSMYPAVGGIVTWASEHAAFVTQASGDPRLWTVTHTLLQQGVPPTDVFTVLETVDPMFERRQLAVITADGSFAVHTGKECAQHAEHTVGENHVVAANIMAKPGTTNTISETFNQTTGPLEYRMLEALVAGREWGGDLRGPLAASVLVAPTNGNPARVNVRVDHSTTPLKDALKIAQVQQAYALTGAASDALTVGDTTTALRLTEDACNIASDEQVLMYRVAALLAHGDTTEARTLLSTLHPRWAETLQRFAEAGHMPFPGSTVEALTNPITPQ